MIKKLALLALTCAPLISCNKCVDMLNVEIYKAEQMVIIGTDALQSNHVSMFDYGYMKGNLAGLKIAQSLCQDCPLN